MGSKQTWISSHRWLVFVLCALSWSVVLNLWFLSLSLRYPSEQVELRPYEQGLAFQDLIDARDRVSTLRLQLSSVVSEPDDAANREVSLKVSGADGAPVSNLVFRLEASRPSSKALDQEITLSESAVKGTYTAKGVFVAGLWHFRWWGKVGGEVVLFEEQVTVPR